MKLFIDVFGWVGAGSLLLGYALVSTQRVEGASLKYQALNLLGAAGLTTNTFYYAAYPSAALNVVWGMIAIAALWRHRGGPRDTGRK